MCGILIQYSKVDDLNETRFSEALRLQESRGPDDLSFKRINNNLLMGSVRLKILDLSDKANQPMLSQKNNCLVFNGEIYNFEEIKDHLQNDDLNLETSCDTEVLLSHLEKTIDKSTLDLNGMWAFGFYIDSDNKIFISRDRFGKKPLYYFLDENHLIISSEIKSIFHLTGKIRTLNKDHLIFYLHTNYWNNEDKTTLYEGVYKVLPGEDITIDLESLSLKFHYENTLDKYISNNHNLDDLDDVISDAVKKRLIADVPIGVFLSGGVDSSLVASYACNHKSNITFISSTSKGSRDYIYSKKASEFLKVPILQISNDYGETAIRRLQKMTKYFELPIPFSGISFGMNALYETANQQGLKVLLDGTGGDEIFGGYYDYYGSSFIEGSLRTFSIYNVLSFILFSFMYPYGSYGVIKETLIKIFYKALKPTLLTENRINFTNNNPFSRPKTKLLFPKNTNSLRSFQAYDLRLGRLQTWLQINDLNSMMYSIESRSPLLDFRLLQFMEIKDSYKFRRGFNKYFLRRLLSRYMIKEVAWRRDKRGLDVEAIYLLKENRIKIVNSVKNSKIINNLFNEADLEFKMEDLFKEKYPENNDLLLRCYSVSLLEEAYNVVLQK